MFLSVEVATVVSGIDAAGDPPLISDSFRLLTLDKLTVHAVCPPAYGDELISQNRARTRDVTKHSTSIQDMEGFLHGAILTVFPPNTHY